LLQVNDLQIVLILMTYEFCINFQKMTQL